jgi:hypothetical protein
MFSCLKRASLFDGFQEPFEVHLFRNRLTKVYQYDQQTLARNGVGVRVLCAVCKREVWQMGEKSATWTLTGFSAKWIGRGSCNLTTQRVHWLNI